MVIEHKNICKQEENNLLNTSSGAFCLFLFGLCRRFK